VDGLTNRQIHMLVTTRAYADASPDVLVAMARAVHRAQRLVHADQAAAAEAIRASGVGLQAPTALTLLVELYEPAIPWSPEVSVEGVLRELALLPEHREPPDLGDVDMSAHVDNRYARRAVGGG
jgi:ABC-type nitrate/sulfonate/bicarbonate transport system substrate-binding protein